MPTNYGAEQSMRSMTEMESFISRFRYLASRTLTEPFQRHDHIVQLKYPPWRLWTPWARKLMLNTVSTNGDAWISLLKRHRALINKTET